jgi:pimeloyl-ACP methyl ester carboxylesterase
MQIQLKNIRLAYDDLGQGQTLLFIHGYPLSRRMWQPQISGLSRDFRVLALDLRGHGESQTVPGPYLMRLLSDDCADFLDRLGIQGPVVVCGLSMGGYVAFEFYRQHSNRVAGLILAATRPASDTPEGRSNRDKSAELARQQGVSAVVEAMLPKLMAPATYQKKPDLVMQVKSIMESISLEGAIGDLQGMKVRPDSTPTLAEIKVPTLVLHGAADQIIPLQEAEKMEGAIPKARLEVLPEAGHLLNLEQPELFNNIIKEFFYDQG